MPSALGVRTINARQNPELIRPPGALPEKDFLQRCVRCVECIQICIGNALQPSFLQSGIEGIFSPRLVARTGYCEFNCTLCETKCPLPGRAAIYITNMLPRGGSVNGVGMY